MSTCLKKLSKTLHQVQAGVSSAFLAPSFTPAVLLFASLVVTSVHSYTLLDFGLSTESPLNFYLWHFTHRYFAHSTANCIILFLFIGTGIAVTLFDLTLISVFVYCVSFFDPFVFYGSSGITFFLLGRLIRPEYLRSSYHLIGLPIKVPYLALVLYTCITFLVSDGIRTTDLLHLFGFFYGLFYDTTILTDAARSGVSRLHQMIFRTKSKPEQILSE